MQWDRKIFTENDLKYIHVLKSFTIAIRTVLEAVIYMKNTNSKLLLSV